MFARTLHFSANDSKLNFLLRTDRVQVYRLCIGRRCLRHFTVWCGAFLRRRSRPHFLLTLALWLSTLKRPRRKLYLLLKHHLNLLLFMLSLLLYLYNRLRNNLSDCFNLLRRSRFFLKQILLLIFNQYFLFYDLNSLFKHLPFLFNRTIQ